MEFSQLILQVLTQLSVEGTERLVKEDELGLKDESTRQCYALLLATAKLRWPGCAAALKFNKGERIVHATTEFGPLDAPPPQREGNIFRGAHMRK
jgi:hypothetical protein